MTKEEIDKWFKENEEGIRKAIQSVGIQPPWLKYPGTPGPRSIAWRMGAGETYMDDWLDWISTMLPAQRIEYIERYSPVPKEWRKWVVYILKSASPQRFVMVPIGKA